MVDVEECVLLISDVHIGRTTSSYNVDIFRARLRILRDNFLAVKRRMIETIPPFPDF